MKPLVSFILLAYNHERFVREALEGALAQTYEPMEIIVSDDASTDGTAAVIEEILSAYRGPKNVRFRRNSANLGLARVINNLFGEAKGEFIVGAAADDVSAAARTETIVRAFQEDEAIHCVFSNADIIDEAGQFQRLHYPVAPARKTISSFEKPFMAVLGATAAYRKAVLTEFGPLSPDINYEDRVLSLRAAILGAIKYLDEPLVRYRRHGANIWNGIMDLSQDAAEWDRYEAKVTRDMVSVLRTRLKDIETGLDLARDKSADLMSLRSKTGAALKRLEVQEAMSEAPRRVRKAVLASRHILSGGAGGPRGAWGFLKRNFFLSSYFKGVQQARTRRPSPH